MRWFFLVFFSLFAFIFSLERTDSQRKANDDDRETTTKQFISSARLDFFAVWMSFAYHNLDSSYGMTVDVKSDRIMLCSVRESPSVRGIPRGKE